MSRSLIFRFVSPSRRSCCECRGIQAVVCTQISGRQTLSRGSILVILFGIFVGRISRGARGCSVERKGSVSQGP